MRTIECQFGLLEDLCRRHLITDQQYADIKYDSEKQQELSDDNKNIQLIKMMQSVTDLTKFENFLSVLCDNGQRHVAAYVVCDTGKKNCILNAAIQNSE